MLVFLIILPLIFLLFSFLYFKLEKGIDNIKLNYHCERNRELKNKLVNLSRLLTKSNLSTNKKAINEQNH